MDRTEEIIVKQLKDGNEKAYKFLYDNHYQVLCHIASGYVHDDFLAETIVADIIFHLWENRKSLEITTSIRGYLVKSVRNRCLDYLKSQYSQHEIASSPMLSSFPVMRYLIADDYPLGRLLENELENEIFKAIENLPDECRNVFKMSRLENKKYTEIAEKMGISVNTVKYHIKHALSLLYKQLHDYLTVFLFLLFTNRL